MRILNASNATDQRQAFLASYSNVIRCLSTAFHSKRKRNSLCFSPLFPSAISAELSARFDTFNPQCNFWPAHVPIAQWTGTKLERGEKDEGEEEEDNEDEDEETKEILISLAVVSSRVQRSPLSPWGFPLCRECASGRRREREDASSSCSPSFLRSCHRRLRAPSREPGG